MLLTGRRPSEVYGLEVRDIDFDRKRVHFRPNESRKRLKTAKSRRRVPLWLQLEAILREYLNSDEAPNEGGCCSLATEMAEE